MKENLSSFGGANFIYKRSLLEYFTILSILLCFMGCIFSASTASYTVSVLLFLIMASFIWLNIKLVKKLSFSDADLILIKGTQLIAAKDHFSPATILNMKENIYACTEEAENKFLRATIYILKDDKGNIVRFTSQIRNLDELLRILKSNQINF